jgi:hypothetical protein
VAASAAPAAALAALADSDFFSLKRFGGKKRFLLPNFVFEAFDRAEKLFRQIVPSMGHFVLAKGGTFCFESLSLSCINHANSQYR